MESDAYIWNWFKNDREDVLSIIYHNNVDFLFCYGKKFTTDEAFILDVIQDMFYDLIKYRKNMSETDNIRLYLLKSFRRKLLRGLERKVKLKESTGVYNLVPDIVFSVEEEFITDESRSNQINLIRQGLRELTAQQREVIYYKYTLGYEYQHISEIMSITYDTARQLVSRGIRSLRKYMTKKDFMLVLIFRKLLK